MSSDKTVRADYPDVITDDAVRVMEALARFDTARKQVMAARIARRADRARKRERIGFLDPNGVIGRTSITVKDAREGNFVGAEIPRDLQRQWIQGTGPAARPGASVEIGLRNVAYALLERRRRLDVRRRGCARPGVDDVARQPAQPEAGDSSRSEIHGGRRAGRRRDEQVGDGLLRQADHRRLAQAAGFHDQDLSRPRPASRRPPRAQRRWLGFLGVDRRRDALHRQQPSAPDRFRRVDRLVSAEDPDRRRSGVVERHPDLARAAARSRHRHDQGLRARRAGRGVLPADGDSRRARPALRRLQHRAVGLHQQRVGCGRVGSRFHQSEHRRDHDDLRLHAHV